MTTIPQPDKDVDTVYYALNRVGYNKEAFEALKRIESRLTPRKSASEAVFEKAREELARLDKMKASYGVQVSMLWNLFQEALTSDPIAGYKLVPIEPTEEMLAAYKEADGDHSDWDDWLEWDGGDATRLYKAMIEAAPPHTEEKE